jgi:hypothetical protein
MPMTTRDADRIALNGRHNRGPTPNPTLPCRAEATLPDCSTTPLRRKRKVILNQISWALHDRHGGSEMKPQKCLDLGVKLVLKRHHSATWQTALTYLHPHPQSRGRLSDLKNGR